MNKKIKVVIISGGGVYGIIPCLFLKHINKHDLSNIDVIGGTSVGGILALHLSRFHDNEKLYNDFKNNVKNFFVRNFTNYINPFSLKYNAKSVQATLKKIIPGTVSECKNKFVVPCFNFKSVSPVIFHNFDKSYEHMNLWSIARATSAAPMYYEPYSENILLDGGILENLPIITTASIICKYYNTKPSDLDIFAIGTGIIYQNFNKTQKQVSHFSKLDWARELMPIVTTGGNEMMSQLWGETMGFNSFNMFNPVIIDGIMDNIDYIDLIEQKSEIYKGKFLNQWKVFINNKE